MRKRHQSTDGRPARAAQTAARAGDHGRARCCRRRLTILRTACIAARSHHTGWPAALLFIIIIVSGVFVWGFTARDAAARSSQPSSHSAPTAEVPALSSDEISTFFANVTEALDADAEMGRLDDGELIAALRSNPCLARSFEENRKTSDEQVETIVAELQRLKQLYRDRADLLEREIYRVSHLSIGRSAPNIRGLDFDLQPFDLTDYRGKVVLIIYWSESCLECRAQFPYLRALATELQHEPFALLGVTSDPLETVRSVQREEDLIWRSWTDGPTGRGTTATAWGVRDRPATWVVDAEGIIRHQSVRDEEMLEAVRGLLN